MDSQKKTNLLIVRNNITSGGVGLLYIKLNEKSNLFNIRFLPPHDIDKEAIIWSDAVMICRAFDSYSRKIAKMAKSAKRMLLFLLDDNLLDVDDVGLAKRFKKNMTDVWSQMDVLITSNPLIAAKYACGKKYILERIDVFFEEDRIIPQNDAPDMIRIVSANTDRKDVLEVLIVPIMQQLFERYKNRISFTFIGALPDTSKINEENLGQIEKIPFMPGKEYRKFFSTHHFDIGLAPNLGCKLARYKHYGKFLTYAAHGVLAICPNIEPYTYVMKNEENRLLVDFTPESWYEAIVKAIDDVDLRKRCIENAYSLLENDYSIDKRIEYFKEDFSCLCGYKADPEVRVKDVKGFGAAYYYYTEMKASFRKNKFFSFIKNDFVRIFMDILLAIKRDMLNLKKKTKQADIICKEEAE